MHPSMYLYIIVNGCAPANTDIACMDLSLYLLAYPSMHPCIHACIFISSKGMCVCVRERELACLPVQICSLPVPVRCVRVWRVWRGVCGVRRIAGGFVCARACVACVYPLHALLHAVCVNVALPAPCPSR